MSLSDKIVICMCMENPENWIHINDVKKSIKKLKNLSTKNEYGNDVVLIKQLNKEFGDKLI